jgi:hypothetical protein
MNHWICGMCALAFQDDVEQVGDERPGICCACGLRVRVFPVRELVQTYGWPHCAHR